MYLLFNLRFINVALLVSKPNKSSSNNLNGKCLIRLKVRLFVFPEVKSKEKSEDQILCTKCQQKIHYTNSDISSCELWVAQNLTAFSL